MPTPEEKRKYAREYVRTPQQQAYRKKYRATPEYRAKQIERVRRWRAKRREHAGLDTAQDE